MRLWFLPFFLSACASPPPPSVVLSLENLTCVQCEADLQAVLAPYSGVVESEFRPDHAELLIQYDPRTTSARALALLLEAEGYRTQVGPGTGYYLGGGAFPAHADIAWVNEWDWEQFGVPGKITVLQSEDPYCRACGKVDQVLAEELAQSEDVALRRVRAGDTPREHYAVVYDSTGQIIDRLPSPTPQRLKHAIAIARTQRVNRL